MHLIRNNVFETNSSSCHSLEITDETELNDIPIPDDEGVITLLSGDFGWELRTYYSFESKAAYLIVYIRDWCKDQKEDRKEEFKTILEDLIKEKTGGTVAYELGFWDRKTVTYKDKQGKEFSYETNEGDGYIDHQSVEDKDLHFLFDKTHKDYIEGELERFLFNKKSVLETDNDNK